jgi:uncharacterized protein YhfF
VTDNASKKLEEFWQGYLEHLPTSSGVPQTPYRAGAFGDNAELANELAILIVRGTKTSTCSALWDYEAEGDALPEAGEKSILLDGQGNPLCIIETTEVFIKPYNEVDAGFAFEEGEGDRSLEYWREAHWKFFSRTLPAINKKPTQDMPLVCERFRVIYKPV